LSVFFTGQGGAAGAGSGEIDPKATFHQIVRSAQSADDAMSGSFTPDSCLGVPVNWHPEQKQ
jgi:hypothetical protein